MACDNCGNHHDDRDEMLCPKCKPINIRAEIQKCTDEIETAYWAFTRTANGKPPSMVCPQAYTRRAELQARLRS